MMNNKNGQQLFLQIHPSDNVLVALKDLPQGALIEFNSVELILRDAIPAKHKFFINDLKAGSAVIMYGTLVGKVVQDVSQGSLMTTANTQHAADEYAYHGFRQPWQAPDVSQYRHRTFLGYHRSDGRVG